jgi:hypothetical protein
LTANLAKGNWLTQWAAYGMENKTVPKPGVQVTMPVIAVIGDEAFANDRSMLYTAKAGKAGSAK